MKAEARQVLKVHGKRQGKAEADKRDTEQGRM